MAEYNLVSGATRDGCVSIPVGNGYVVEYEPEYGWMVVNYCNETVHHCDSREQAMELAQERCSVEDD